VEDYEKAYIGDDYPLDVDSLNRLALNDDFLYQKICVESPRGIVLWKQKTTDTNLDSSVGQVPTVLDGFSFLWTPDGNRNFLATFSFGYLTTPAGSGNGRYVLAIYLDGISQNGLVSWLIGPSQQRCGYRVEAFIQNPSPSEHLIEVRYEMVNMGVDCNIQASATEPTQFFVEDIGPAGRIVSK
jgi:hypothetical protein